MKNSNDFKLLLHIASTLLDMSKANPECVTENVSMEIAKSLSAAQEAYEELKKKISAKTTSCR